MGKSLSDERQEELVKEMFAEFDKIKKSHPINHYYIDYGMRLGFFPVYWEQLNDNHSFRDLKPVWKCYYFLLQSFFNVNEGPFYKRDADFASLLNVSLNSNYLSRARKYFSENGWINIRSGGLSGGGQRRATEYLNVKWAMPPSKGEGKRWAKVDRATFYYLLKVLRDKPRFHDIIVVWVSLLAINLSKIGNGFKGTNSFTVNKRDIATYTNQSQQKIKKAFDCLKNEGFIGSWIEPKLNSYYIEDFVLYGHDEKRGYSFEGEQWFELVRPINEFIDEMESYGYKESEKKIITQAKLTLEEYKDIFDVYSKYYIDKLGKGPTDLISEPERLIQLGTLIRKHGPDKIKTGIHLFFMSDPEDVSLNKLYRYLDKLYNKKVKKKKEPVIDIYDDELPF